MFEKKKFCKMVLVFVLFAVCFGAPLSIYDVYGSHVAKVYGGGDGLLLLEPAEASLVGSFVNVSGSSSWVACSGEWPSLGWLVRLRGALDRLVSCELLPQDEVGLRVVLDSNFDVLVSSVAPPVHLQTPAPKVDPSAAHRDERSFVSRLWWVLVLPPMLLLLFR